MARSAAVASAPRVTHAPSANAAPANDAPAVVSASLVIRTYALTDAHRTRCRTAARALPASALGDGTLPPHLDARLDWMDATLNAAWRDRDALSRVALEGTPLSVADIDDLGVAVLFARECVLRARVVAPTVVHIGAVDNAQVEQLSDAQLSDEAARTARVVCDALVTRVRLGAVSKEVVRVQRPLVKKVREARTGRSRRHAFDALVAFCAESDRERWLRAQCLGEGAALDRLRDVQREWGRRIRRDEAAPKSERTELAVRAFALATKGVQRLAVIGRYLTQRDPERRGEYAAFRPPVSRRAKKKAPVTDPT